MEIEMKETKRFFWLKLQFAFFATTECRIIKAMDNGADIILLFFEMIGRAANRSGYLRLTEAEPYTADTLSLDFGYSKAVCEAALVALQRFGLIDVLDNGTIRINDFESFIGSESFWAEKKRKQRAKQTSDNVGTMSPKCPDNVADKKGQRPKDIDIDIDTRLDEDDNNNITNCVSHAHARAREENESENPSEQEVREFLESKCPDIDPDCFVDLYQANGWTDGNGEHVRNWRNLALKSQEAAAAGNYSSDYKTALWYRYKETFGTDIPERYFDNIPAIRRAIENRRPLSTFTALTVN